MKGFWFMIEAVIAGVILISFLSFVASRSIAREETDLTPQAYKILEGLNRQGLLKVHAVAGNFTAINNQVSFFAYSHTIQICTPQGCSGGKPSGGNIWAGSYLIPGDAGYAPLEVKLYLYR